MPETVAAVRELTFGDAIREALREEMRRDPRVVLFGEDVAEVGVVAAVAVATSGLLFLSSRPLCSRPTDRSIKSNSYCLGV